MANKDLLKQAIAEAKSVREAAIANAKEALEESLTPHLKDMLAAKLQEMEGSQEDEVVNESVEELEEKNHYKDEMEEQLAEAEDEAEEPAAEEEAEVDSDKSEDEAPESTDEDRTVGEIPEEEFKTMIQDIVEKGIEDAIEEDELEVEDEEEELEDIDLDPETQGQGDETDPEVDNSLQGSEEQDSEEINLEELLAELEAMDETNHEEEMEEGSVNQMEAEADTKDHNVNNVRSSALQEELNEALETIKTLKQDLQEVNLLNSKLLYVNKIFKANSLNESQKVNIIAAFDKAETVKETKLVYETVSETFAKQPKAANTRTKIAEGKLGMASKATGTSAAKPEIISEVSSAVERMQVLAGIKPRQF